MLSNIFLHQVLDKWFEEVAWPRLRGNCQLVRFADDFVVALEDRHSGKRLLDVLGKCLRWFRYQVARMWRKWLAHRSRLRRMN